MIDIPARALSEPFAYGVLEALDEACQVGATVLVPFGRRVEAGYVVARSESLGKLPGAEGLELSRIKPVREVVAAPAFSAASAELAFWMSREYVAPLSECLRLLLPPAVPARSCGWKTARMRMNRRPSRPLPCVG